MTSVKKALISARALIASPETWTQRNLAVDSNDRCCSPTSSKAIRRCASGAVDAVCINNIDLAYDVIDALYKSMRKLDKNAEYGITIEEYNDTHTHEGVMALFDDAIANEA